CAGTIRARQVAESDVIDLIAAIRSHAALRARLAADVAVTAVTAVTAARRALDREPRHAQTHQRERDRMLLDHFPRTAAATAQTTPDLVQYLTRRQPRLELVHRVVHLGARALDVLADLIRRAAP